MPCEPTTRRDAARGGTARRDAAPRRTACRAAARARTQRARVRLRPLERTDAAHLAALFERLSPGSRYLRYLSPVPALPASHLRTLAAIDHDRHEAVGAFEAGVLVGVAHYVRDRADPDRADVSVEVADSHHRRGLGTRLVRDLARRARRHGVGRFTASVLSANTAVLALIRGLGWPLVAERAGATLEIELRSPATDGRRSGADALVLRVVQRP
jgi:RimJ/RimL family protein N-acetyltransferase